jgi:hypothetical protein
MGLDIYFEKRKTEYSDLAYFRKVNFLVLFFEKQLCCEIENMTDLEVEKDNIEELLCRCNEVLADHSLAKTLLPTIGGFFFGSTEYDEYYFKDVERVRDTCIELLPEFDDLADNESIIFKIWY